jgi:hypothetical protein
MDVDAVARRCPRSEELGLARLERHRLAVMREGWLTAIRNPSSLVHGMLWDLALSDRPALDWHESLSQGLCVKLTQAVIAKRGPKRDCPYRRQFRAWRSPSRLHCGGSGCGTVMAASGGGRCGAGETCEVNLTIDAGRQRDVPNFGSRWWMRLNLAIKQKRPQGWSDCRFPRNTAC